MKALECEYKKNLQHKLISVYPNIWLWLEDRFPSKNISPTSSLYSHKRKENKGDTLNKYIYAYLYVYMDT